MSSKKFVCGFSEAKKYEKGKLSEVADYIRKFLWEHDFRPCAVNAKILANPTKCIQNTDFLGHVSWKENGARSMTIRVRVSSLRGSGIIEDHVVKVSPQKKDTLGDFMVAARKLDPNPKKSSPEGVSGNEHSFARQMNHVEALKILQANTERIDEIFSIFLGENPEKRLDVGRVQALIRDQNLVSRSLIIDASDLRQILSWLNEYNPGKWVGRQMGLEAQARLEYTPEPEEEYESEVATEEVSEQSLKESLLDKYYFKELPRIISLYQEMVSIQKVRIERFSKSQLPELEVAREKTHLLELEMLLRDAKNRQRIFREVLKDMS